MFLFLGSSVSQKAPNSQTDKNRPLEKYMENKEIREYIIGKMWNIEKKEEI